MKGKMLVIPSILLVLVLTFSIGIIGCEEEVEPSTPEPTPTPTPTPTPEPTPTPTPTPTPEPEPPPPEPEPEPEPPPPVKQPETDTISWEEAAEYIGATTSVCGEINGGYEYNPPNITLLMGESLGVGVGIEVEPGVFEGDAVELFDGQFVCVSGVITDAFFGGPSILVTDASQIVIQEKPEEVLAGTTVYVSVSVDGELLVAAQPVIVTDLTVDAVIVAAHAAYYPDGEIGYTAGIDPSFGVYLITQCWGVVQIPFIILNDSPVPGPIITTFVNATPVVANDNIIICTASIEGAATPVSLTATLFDDSATLTATSWIFNTMTFTYTSEPLADANIVDPATGTSLGTTDADGHLTVTVPESGIVAIEGLAALMVAPPEEEAPAAPARMSWEEAANHIDEEITVCGAIIDSFDIGTSMLLGMGASVFDAACVGIELDYGILADLPDDLYVGQEICVTGTTHMNPNGGASISVTDPSQIAVEGEEPEEPEAAAMSWEEAKDHIGETATVTGTIIDSTVYQDQTILGMGVSVFDAATVGIVVNTANLGEFATGLIGKTVTVTGLLITNPYGGANIEVTDESQVVVQE